MPWFRSSSANSTELVVYVLVSKQDPKTKVLYVLVVAIVVFLVWRAVTTNFTEGTKDGTPKLDGQSSEHDGDSKDKDDSDESDEGSVDQAEDQAVRHLAKTRGEKESQTPRRKVSNIDQLKLSHELATPAGISILPGLNARRLITNGKAVGISLLVTNLQAPPKEILEDEPDPMAVLATTMLQGTDLEVELSLERPDDAVDHISRTLDSKSFTANSPYLSHTIKKVSQRVAEMLGSEEESTGDPGRIMATMTTVLDITQPDRIRLSPELLDDLGMGSTILLPIKSLLLARAGDNICQSNGWTLPTLEIGPWIPIDADTGQFAMSKWNIHLLVIVYDPPAATRGTDILPRVLWDPAFDFVGMMQSREEDEDGDAYTRVVLVVSDHAAAAGFRKQIRRLCKMLSAAGHNNAAEGRLDLFKRRLFYCCEPIDPSDARSEILPVWAGKGDPLYKHRPNCTCGAEGKEGGRSDAEDADADGEGSDGFESEPVA